MRGAEGVSNKGGKWYPENRGSRKILARSRNLANVSTKSRRLVFFLFGSEIAWVSGSDFQTSVSASLGFYHSPALAMDVQSALAPLACLHIQKVHFQWQSIYTMIIPTPFAEYFAEAVRLYTWEQVAHKIKTECLPPPPPPPTPSFMSWYKEKCWLYHILLYHISYSNWTTSLQCRLVNSHSDSQGKLPRSIDVTFATTPSDKLLPTSSR